MERQKTKRRATKKNTRKGTNRTKTHREHSIKTEYITNYQTSESIVKIILDKIINLSIRQSRLNKINTKIKDYCFEFIQNQIEPLFEEIYINYTNSNKNSNILFWKKKIPNETKWVEIIEPETPKYDRFEGAFANIKELELKNKKSSKMNKIKEGKEKDVLINSSSKGSITVNEEENKEELKNLKNTKKLKLDNNELKNKEEGKTINKQSTVQQSNISSRANKPNKRIAMVDYPSIDIPEIEREYNHEEYDPPNINYLRKEKEEEKKRREKEEKIKRNEEKIIKKQGEGEKTNKKQRILDSNKFTFDSNGQIISFKQYKLDNLTKDFKFVKNIIKENIESIKAAKKKSVNTKTENAVNEEEIIKNPAEEEKAEKSEKKEKKEKILPSGSNFQIILPNIGVVIKENLKIKEGGREFNKFLDFLL